MARLSTPANAASLLRAITPARRRSPPCFSARSQPGHISLWITLIGGSTIPAVTGADVFRTKKDEMPRPFPPRDRYRIESSLLRIATTPPVWAACLAAFQQELTPQQFATWIRPLACADDAGRLKLTAPNRFVLQWVKDRFGSRIETLVRQATGTLVSVDFALADGRPAPLTAPPTALPTPPDSRGATVDTLTVRAEPTGAQGPRIVSTRKTDVGGLNPTFTFDTFVAGRANQLARAAVLQVADHPTSYNPLFVYGGVGLGKTHLIQAIGHHIQGQNPSAKIR